MSGCFQDWFAGFDPAVRRLALATVMRVAAVTLAVTPALTPVAATAMEATPPSSVAATLRSRVPTGANA